ncbi:serine O-acetyltransferase [Actinosynnema sp. NPDC023658]|uniref:serine O-acetyltransferase n=1 Tax=Actinosynnema sp. NPDC023658 TaxID=3155465 RepID=UPI0033EE5F30
MSGCADVEVREAVERAAEQVIEPWADRLDALVDRSHVVRQAVDLAVDDLLALTHRDPASKGSWEYVLAAYSCFQAVLTHRLAHAVLTGPGADTLPRLTLARSMSETAKVRSGVEIHPAATIGPRFVVDHGIGTVIGEDVIIGSDCYVLQAVVLGARGIADNVTGRRHPRLGDRVQVGGFARVLGPVSIGDDVVIGSHALVRADVAAGAQVAVLHQYQMVVGSQPITIYGVEALGEYRFRLHGIGLDRRGMDVEILGPSQVPLAPGDWSILQSNAKCLTVQIAPRARGLRSVTHIRVRHDGSEVIVGIPVSGRSRLRPLPRSA